MGPLRLDLLNVGQLVKRRDEREIEFGGDYEHTAHALREHDSGATDHELHRP